MAENRIRDYAASRGVTRADGQPIGTWAEFKVRCEELTREGRGGFVYELKYDRFYTGWENEQQPVLMRKLNARYRAWPVQTRKRVPKGMFGLMLSKAASCRKGDIDDVTKRQQVAERNANGVPIRAIKDMQAYNPIKHLRIRVNREPAQKR